jgi:hypothetical protein
MDTSNKVVKEKVEYDGYYRIDSTIRGGAEVHIYCRGNKLRSWLNFEKSLNSNISCNHTKITEEEYMANHWTAFPLEDNDVAVKIKKTKVKELPASVVVNKEMRGKVAKVAKVRKTTAKTDRDIGEAVAFVKQSKTKVIEQPAVKKRGRKTKVQEDSLDKFF